MSSPSPAAAAAAATLWTTPRLVFRGVEEEDTAFLKTLSSDALSFVNSATSMPVPRSTTTSKSYYAFLTEHCLMSAIICHPAVPTPTPIGVISLRDQNSPTQKHHRRCEIFIDIAQPHQGQGYGTEALRWVLRWAFRRAGMHRVAIRAGTWNEGAVRLYERVGFVREGRLREEVWFDGKFMDVIVMGMLEDEWRAKYADSDI